MRLDKAVVERGLVTSRTRATRSITAGHVRVNGTVVTKASTPVTDTDTIQITNQDPWVARSAHKLLGALEDFGLAQLPAGLRCLDAGASTGGFTQVLLEHGAAHVYAVDVGHDQLAPVLKQDPRVTDMSGHNLRELTPAWVDGRVDLVVADVSFISLTLLIEPLVNVTQPGGTLLLMVKPQFEAGRQALDKHGVVTLENDRRTAVEKVRRAIAPTSAEVVAQSPSRLPGPAGNIEYFLHVVRVGS